MKVMRHWLPREVVDTPSLEVFIVRLGFWITWLSERCPCPWQWGWTRWSLKTPSNLNHSLIPWFYAHSRDLANTVSGQRGMMHPLLTQTSVVGEVNHKPATPDYLLTIIGASVPSWGVASSTKDVQFKWGESTLKARSDGSHPSDSERRNCINMAMCDEVFPFIHLPVWLPVILLDAS